MKIDKILIFTFSFLIFSNVINYMSKADILLLTSVHLFLLTAMIASYLMLKKPNFSFIHMKLNWWLVFYLCMILFWFILPHNEFSIGEFRRKMLSIMSLFIFTVFIFYDNEKISTVKYAVLFTILISVFNNIYEFINPFVFFPIDSPLGVIGRSAGFYINPTISGTAIVLGIILSITSIPKIYRIWFMMFSFVGVFLTFSRSAIVGFVMVYFYMTIKKQVDFKYTFIIPILFFVGLSFYLPFLTQFVEATHEGGASNIINRTMWFLDPVSHIDHSQIERQQVAAKAFKMLADNPFFGAGLGSTLHWDARVSTHNIHLSNAAEMGLIGLLIYPFLIYSTIIQARAETKNIAGVFVVFTFFIGFFSHNILDEFYFLFAFALMANLSYKSLEKSKDV